MGAPVSYVVKAPRSSELMAWLRCNDVDPRDVPYGAAVVIGTPDGEAWFIRFDSYVRTAAGVLRYDPFSEDFEYVERSVPLVNDPPIWWLAEWGTPPTGEAGALGGVGVLDATRAVTTP